MGISGDFSPNDPTDSLPTSPRSPTQGDSRVGATRWSQLLPGPAQPPTTAGAPLPSALHPRAAGSDTPRGHFCPIPVTLSPRPPSPGLWLLPASCNGAGQEDRGRRGATPAPQRLQTSLTCRGGWTCSGTGIPTAEAQHVSPSPPQTSPRGWAPSQKPKGYP